MSHKRMAWVLLSVLILVFLGCPKKAPEPPPPEIEMETREEPPPPVPMPEAMPEDDMQEVDPMESDDLRVVNEEARRRGFDPNVYFDFDQSDLRNEARQLLSTNAQFLREHPEFTLTIEGHCDERGTNEYNLALGDRRAETVKDYLTSLGLSAARFRTISYGEERPACTESTESCWQRNRRGYMLITGRAQ